MSVADPFPSVPDREPTDTPRVGEPPRTELAWGLARTPEYDDPRVLAGAWVDLTATLTLSGWGRARPGIGAHLRRSFLGGLEKGASEAARAGAPCPWSPPCALDLFRREQFRTPAGIGMPKPYVLNHTRQGRDLLVSLRIFGLAGSWATEASAGLAQGLRTVLPHARLGLPAAQIADRRLSEFRLDDSPVPRGVRIVLTAPMDLPAGLATGPDAGRDIRADPGAILSRALLRANWVSRWCGASLSPEARERLRHAIAQLRFDASGLNPAGQRHSANAKRQARTDQVMQGHLDVAGDLAEIWPILRIAERVHVGRKAVEGLGSIRLFPV